MARGEINSVLGMTEGRFRTMIKSALRPCWRNSSRKTFIQSVRQRGINPATGRERFVLVCVDCGKEMGMSEKERRTKIDGTLEKRAKSVGVRELKAHLRNALLEFSEVRFYSFCQHME